MNVSSLKSEACGIESSKSATRPVQCKVHGASTDVRKPEIGSREHSSHLTDARTGRHSSTEAISGDSELPWKIMPHLSEMTTSEAIGGQGCRVPVAGTALQSGVNDKEVFN